MDDTISPWETKELEPRVLSWLSPPTADLHFPQQQVLEKKEALPSELLQSFTPNTHTRLLYSGYVCSKVEKHVDIVSHIAHQKSSCLDLQGPGIDLRPVAQSSPYTVMRLSKEAGTSCSSPYLALSTSKDILTIWVTKCP